MTQALMAIEQAAFRIEATSRNASRGVRVALGFAIVAAGYGVIVATGMLGAG